VSEPRTPPPGDLQRAKGNKERRLWGTQKTMRSERNKERRLSQDESVKQDQTNRSQIQTLVSSPSLSLLSPSFGFPRDVLPSSSLATLSHNQFAGASPRLLGSPETSFLLRLWPRCLNQFAGASHHLLGFPETTPFLQST
jgi:hypothetical protein